MIAVSGVQWWCSAQGVPWSWTWRSYPGVWLLILAMAAAYVAGVGRARATRRRRPREGLRRTSFAVGLVLLWLALDWPVGALGAGYLASVHMVQFLVIVMLAPPFLLYGLAGGPPSEPARSGGRPGALAAPFHPMAALAIFSVLVVMTHVPVVVDTFMASQLGSLALDLAWLVAGCVLWWPIVPPAPLRPELSRALKVGYLFVAMVPDKGVASYLLFSRLPVYRTYELAPPTGWLSARADQGLAGGLMITGGTLIMAVFISVIFFRWAAQEARPEAVDDGGQRPAS